MRLNTKVALWLAVIGLLLGKFETGGLSAAGAVMVMFLAPVMFLAE